LSPVQAAYPLPRSQHRSSSCAVRLGRITTLTRNSRTGRCQSRVSTMAEGMTIASDQVDQAQLICRAQPPCLSSAWAERAVAWGRSSHTTQQIAMSCCRGLPTRRGRTLLASMHLAGCTCVSRTLIFTQSTITTNPHIN